jgi:hypothetical protein
MIALIVGTLLAVGALAYVLAPLFLPVAAGRTSTMAVRGRREAHREPTESELAVSALREIEFDRATGKLSDADYAELKAAYTRQAIAAMRAEDAAGAMAGASATVAEGDDAVEAKILAYRLRRASCDVCGPRPEVDALWCSSCGRWLAGRCAHCNASVSEPGARFCSGCGKHLAA